MSNHAAHQHTPTPPAGFGPDLIDLVPGEQPVPITVWRTARTGDDQNTTIPLRLAYRLISAYSHPGQSVIDLTTDHALTTMCLHGGRHHHQAWFTDTTDLIIRPAKASTPSSRDLHTEGEEDCDGVGEWFGDDLTDPTVPPTRRTPITVRSNSASAAASLVVACWPLHSRDATHRGRLANLLTTCTQLLRPHGCLVLVAGTPTGEFHIPHDLSPLVNAAHNAGLVYLQHIVAVSATVDGERFVYHATDEELLTLAHTNTNQGATTHLPVHMDLFVFSKHQNGSGHHG